jgi:hypothetical protein
MIDFSKITKTLDGYDCHYFGTREYAGTTLHCFAVMHPTYGIKEVVYDQKGRRLCWIQEKYEVIPNVDCQIVKPPKIVSMTRWLTIKKASAIAGAYYLEICENKNDLPQGCSEPQKHLFTFEVDE